MRGKVPRFFKLQPGSLSACPELHTSLKRRKLSFQELDVQTSLLHPTKLKMLNGTARERGTFDYDRIKAILGTHFGSKELKECNP
ncbi:hypothetical protein Y1Q_0011664 [Alligator mississippiensis]|uniref:Uncharacterized protein n=1 Tax=Alligator mississippiensis TaxID=8496 RepID=A0A151M0R7_ALLMI|nr:hypothetical protein Y1Q_0011664 [Alligator mississippiensis]